MPEAVGLLLEKVETLTLELAKLKAAGTGKGEKLIGLKAIAAYYKMSVDKALKLSYDKKAPMYKNGTGARARNYCYTNEMDDYFRLNQPK